MVVVVEGLDTFAGHEVKLQAKNEYYIARYLESGGGGGRMVDGPVLACTPDLICVIDSDLGEPRLFDWVKAPIAQRISLTFFNSQQLGGHHL